MGRARRVGPSSPEHSNQGENHETHPLLLLLLELASLSLVSTSAQAQFSPNVLPFAPPSVSTVPASGDGNPYGVAYVPATVPTDGVLQQGDILVANFNGPSGIQGTGTTIVRVSATGQVSLFFQTSVLGLTGALGILSNGVVIVGNLPTTDGTAATAGLGVLTFIDRFGNLVGTVAGNGIHGPSGLAVSDPRYGNGNSSLRQPGFDRQRRSLYRLLQPGRELHGKVLTVTLIGSHDTPTSLMPAPFVLGPLGLASDAARDILYVASSNDNAVYSISSAGSRGTMNGTGNVIYNDAVHFAWSAGPAMTPDRTPSRSQQRWVQHRSQSGPANWWNLPLPASSYLSFRSTPILVEHSVSPLSPSPAARSTSCGWQRWTTTPILSICRDEYSAVNTQKKGSPAGAPLLFLFLAALRRDPAASCPPPVRRIYAAHFSSLKTAD